MTDQAEARELKACPWCNKPLTQRHGVNGRANCRTEGCYGAKMPVVNLDVPEDVSAWNARATDRERMLALIKFTHKYIADCEDDLCSYLWTDILDAFLAQEKKL